MNLILVLLLAAVAWYLLSGLGTRQRVGGQGNRGSDDRDFRVRTARSSTDAMDTTMKSEANSNNQGSRLVQPEDAQQKNGQPSVSSNGSFQTSTGQAQQGSQQQNNQAQNQDDQLQSGSTNFGEDSGTLQSMQDQAGANQAITDWQSESLTNLDQGGGQNLATGHGINDGQMANGSQTGLTQEIGNLYENSVYDGGLGSYEGTDLSANTGIEAGGGDTGNGGTDATSTTTQSLNASGGTQEVNAYQPQLTGFSDATTTDENGQKVTSIEQKRKGNKKQKR